MAESGKPTTKEGDRRTFLKIGAGVVAGAAVVGVASVAYYNNALGNNSSSSSSAVGSLQNELSSTQEQLSSTQAQLNSTASQLSRRARSGLVAEQSADLDSGTAHQRELTTERHPASSDERERADHLAQRPSHFAELSGEQRYSAGNWAPDELGSDTGFRLAEFDRAGRTGSNRRSNHPIR